MSFLQRVQDFFRMLFAGSSPEHKKMRELKKIQQNLRTIIPPVFKNGQVLPSFATAMMSFWQFLVPIRDVLTATIGNTDAKIAEKYFDYLFESLLTADQCEMRTTFTYDCRKQMVFAGDNPQAILADMENEFSRFLRIFSQPEFSEMDRQLRRLVIVLDVCSYNFGDFFLLFDAAFSLDSDSSSPKFLPVPPQQMVNELSDFFFVVYRFMLDERIAELIVKLRERLEKTTFDTIQMQKMIKIYCNADSFQKTNLPVSLLLNLLKLAKEDPEYVPKKDDAYETYLQKYLLRLSTRYSADTERIRRDLKENSVLAELKVLFPDMELLPIKGYTEELDMLLGNATPFAFKWIKPLKILRTYITQFFDEQYCVIISTLLSDGFFADKSFEQKFSSSYTYCMASAEHFADFESMFAPGQPFDEQEICALIENVQTGATVAEKLEKHISDINLYAQNFLEHDISFFVQLMHCVHEVTNDSKQMIPDLISNVKTLVLGQHLDFIRALEKKCETCESFFSIMKNFTVVQGI